MNKTLFWFRNDLRVFDNVALTEANANAQLMAVYVIDTREFDPNFLGFKKTGLFRIKFLLQCLQDLSDSLKKLGCELIILHGKPEERLFELAAKYNIDRIVASKAVTQEETGIETELSNKLKTLNVELDLVWQNTLVHVLDLNFQIKFLPNVFTEFRKKVEPTLSVRPCVPVPAVIDGVAHTENREIPSLASLGYEEQAADERSLNPQGGEAAGLARVQHYIWTQDLLKTYKDTRNGLHGWDYSSKFSFWLASGCISPRHIYHEVKKYEQQKVANQSTYWLIFELLWRDYFYLIALKFGVRLFKRSGLKHDMNKKWLRNKGEFRKWQEGNTSEPLVNAFMKELQATGYMSNRGRQIAASYLVNDLKIEWWWGAMHFESCLIDYDVCSNWANWNYLAGIGTDPRENRYFDLKIQAEKYDPLQEFQTLWS